METPESLKAQINSTQDIQSVVKTMKALAAVKIRQYEAAIASLRRYSHVIELGLQILLKQQRFTEGLSLQDEDDTASKSPLGLIVFGSDQGLCGRFNQQIAHHLDHYLSTQSDTQTAHRLIAVVGSRPVPTLKDLGITVETTFSVPNNVNEITDKVRDLLLMIEQWREEAECDRLLLFYNRPTSSASYESLIVQLLPLDRRWLEKLRHAPWEARGLPTVLMDPDELFSRLVQQYLFITLYQAMAASLASENASRLAAMQSAEKNIEERLTDLTGQYRQQRQSAITAELLDVVSGFEALTGQE